MKETGILMTPENIQATIEGRKSMTRRVIKPQPTEWEDGGLSWKTEGSINRARFISRMISKCPYGQVGDRLWVRETWCCDCHDPETMPHNEIDVCYKANRETQPASDFCTKWHPSIHMPRWASRITLEIVKIKVERLQDISMADLEKESIFLSDYERTLCINLRLLYATQKFIKLWDSINAKRGYSWDSNSWVWSIEFKVVE